MNRERELFRQGMMGVAHSMLDNLRDLINDDMFSVADVEDELKDLLAVVRVARIISTPESDPYELFVNIMDHVDPLEDQDNA